MYTFDKIFSFSPWQMGYRPWIPMWLDSTIGFCCCVSMPYKNSSHTSKSKGQTEDHTDNSTKVCKSAKLQDCETVRLSDRETGLPLFLLHGLFDCTLSWNPIADPFSTGAFVCVDTSSCPIVENEVVWMACRKMSAAERSMDILGRLRKTQCRLV